MKLIGVTKPNIHGAKIKEMEQMRLGELKICKICLDNDRRNKLIPCSTLYPALNVRSHQKNVRYTMHNKHYFVSKNISILTIIDKLSKYINLTNIVRLQNGAWSMPPYNLIGFSFVCLFHWLQPVYILFEYV